MFLPASVILVLAIIWVFGGALLGVLVGWLGAGLLGLSRARRWLDAAAGAMAILVLYILIGVTSIGQVRMVNDRTLGWRGLLLDHLIIWAVTMVCVTVVGRHSLVVPGGRSPRN